jgi:hypothetical protein
MTLIEGSFSTPFFFSPDESIIISYKFLLLLPRISSIMKRLSDIPHTNDAIRSASHDVMGICECRGIDCHVVGAVAATEFFLFVAETAVGSAVGVIFGIWVDGLRDRPLGGCDGLGEGLQGPELSISRCGSGP